MTATNPASAPGGDLKRTPLYGFNQRHGARFVDFGGWEMPVQFRSILEEHRAVRSAAGLFDVSHMGEIAVEGPEAEKFLEFLLTNRIAGQPDGKAVYSPMCYPDGGTVDDLLVYKWSSIRYLLCVNASNIAKDFAWIQEHAEPFDCEVTDQSDNYALLALQGPAALAILQPLSDRPLEEIAPFHFATGNIAGAEVILSHTGYTGEDGFEIFMKPADAEAITEKIVEAGAEHNLTLAGLGARDSLRLEAGFPLYGHELSAEISPLQAGLGWTVAWAKEEFIGHEALRKQKENGPDPRVAYFKTGSRRILRPDSSVTNEAGEAGVVLSGTLSPHLNEAVGTVLLRKDALKTNLFVEIRGQAAPLEIVKPPFYRRAKP